MPARIFLCYRHDESVGVVLRTRDALENAFERDLQFVGFDTALAGKNFADSVSAEVRASAALFVFISPEWSHAEYDDGISRSMTPQNGTRVAIVTALENEIPVVPILLNGARVPNPDTLPEDMRPMTYRNAIVLGSGESLNEGLEHLCRLVEQMGSAVLGRPLRRLGKDAGNPADTKSANSVFISYRREDSNEIARNLFNRLRGRIGRDRVFIDVDSIMHGTDFRSALDEYLDRSAVVLALIGPSWLISEMGGKPRLFDDSDFVRMELATALRRDKPVIPVLFGGAQLPKQSELPADLKALPYRHAIFLKHAGARDLDLSTSGLEGAIAKYVPAKLPWWRKLLPF